MNTLITKIQIKIQYKAYLTSFLTHTYIFACLNFLIFTLWFLEIHTFDIHKLTLSYFQDWHTDWNLAIIDNYQQSIHRHVGAIRQKTKNLQIYIKTSLIYSSSSLLLQLGLRIELPPLNPTLFKTSSFNRFPSYSATNVNLYVLSFGAESIQKLPSSRGTLTLSTFSLNRTDLSSLINRYTTSFSANFDLTFVVQFTNPNSFNALR